MMGAKAAELLLKQINLQEPAIETVLVDTQLLVRSSSKQFQPFGV